LLLHRLLRRSLLLRLIVKLRMWNLMHLLGIASWDNIEHHLT